MLRGDVNILATIEAKLSRHPHLHYTADACSISVDPLDDAGFTVWLSVNGDRYTVGFDGWHEAFPSEDQAVDCFELGLFGRCRLAVSYRGDTATKWVLESREREDGPWIPDSETGRLFVPFWRRVRVVHRQNRLMDSGTRASALGSTARRSGAP